MVTTCVLLIYRKAVRQTEEMKQCYESKILRAKNDMTQEMMKIQESKRQLHIDSSTKVTI